jgi:hypothetical protein
MLVSVLLNLCAHLDLESGDFRVEDSKIRTLFVDRLDLLMPWDCITGARAIVYQPLLVDRRTRLTKSGTHIQQLVFRFFPALLYTVSI